jgi:hypothetical protein
VSFDGLDKKLRLTSKNKAKVLHNGMLETACCKCGEILILSSKSVKGSELGVIVHDGKPAPICHKCLDNRPGPWR